MLQHADIYLLYGVTSRGDIRELIYTKQTKTGCAASSPERRSKNLLKLNFKDSFRHVFEMSVVDAPFQRIFIALWGLGCFHLGGGGEDPTHARLRWEQQCVCV